MTVIYELWGYILHKAEFETTRFYACFRDFISQQKAHLITVDCMKRTEVLASESCTLLAYKRCKRVLDKNIV